MTEREAWLAEDARRRAKRRAQWRESKRRHRLRRGGLVGWLHSLGCVEREHRGNRGCVPIPMYAFPLKDAA